MLAIHGGLRTGGCVEMQRNPSQRFFRSKLRRVFNMNNFICGGYIRCKTPGEFRRIFVTEATANEARATGPNVCRG